MPVRLAPPGRSQNDFVQIHICCVYVRNAFLTGAGFPPSAASARTSSGHKEDWISPICAFLKEEHTDTGLSDTAADGVRELAV